MKAKGWVHLSSFVLFFWGMFFAILHCFAQSPSEAARHFDEGRYEDAFEIYRQLALDNPEDLRLRYNAGVAAYRGVEYSKAIDQFDAASLSSDLILQQQAHYNLANAFYRRGEETEDFAQKSEDWKQSIARYENALRIHAEDDLARENLAFVKKQLEELEQQNENEQSNDQNDSENQQEESNQNGEEESQEGQSNSQQEDQSQQNDSDSNDSNSNDSDDSNSNDSNSNDSNSNDSDSNDSNDSEQNDSNDSDQNDSDQNDSGSFDEGDLPQNEEGKMTIEQARQLLDSERDEAKAMIFRPPNRSSRNRRFNDW